MEAANHDAAQHAAAKRMRADREVTMIRRHVLALACAAGALLPFHASAAGPIKIGFPIPLSGPTAVYGVPILKGAEMAVQDINAAGGVLGRKLELLPRDSKGNPDEAVRVSRELIFKDNVDFLIGTLTSAEAPAVSTIAKENHIVFIAPSAETVRLTAPENLHPYIFRTATTTAIEGAAGAVIMAKWPDLKRIATIAPDYAYGRDAVAAFLAEMKKLRPDVQVVDQQWPKLGEPDFTPFITAQMSKRPDAVFCEIFAGDFITFAKQAGPLGYFKAIHNRLADGGQVGSIDTAIPLGADYPYGIWADAYDPVVWPTQKSAEYQAYERNLAHFMKSKYGSGWAIQGYASVQALVDAIQKAGTTNDEKVAKAMLGLTYQTPLGPHTFDPLTHESNTGDFWGEMVKDPAYPFAVIKDPTYYNPMPATN
jgi:branched-chain amino acid transport system substrate-binding protein